MLFNSIDFVLFFPIVTIAYFSLPKSKRWILLFFSSCFFYGVFMPQYLGILFLIILIDYCAGLHIETSAGPRKKYFLLMSLFANLSILIFFKYLGLATKCATHLGLLLGESWVIPHLDLILPIGLSFHTFQAMSYTIEVYYGRQTAERHLGIYAVYVLFFPQLVAGPIERPQNLLHQFHEPRDFDYSNAVSGLRLMLLGLIKKVVIADRIGLLVDAVYHQPRLYPAPVLMLASMGFALQIYGDFSGYSDIAIGSARVLGFRLMPNFRRPYLAQSMSEFWRRWHISLSTWFRDYVYIPLGGNRTGWLRGQFNLFVTFLLSGLWHGGSVNFALWGALNGFYLIARNVTHGVFPNQKQLLGDGTFGVAIRRVRTFLLASLAWIFFRSSTREDCAYTLKSILFSYSEWIDISQVKIAISSNAIGVTILNAILAGSILLLYDTLEERGPLTVWFNTQATWLRYGAYYLGVLSILFLGLLGSSQFIYYQF